MIIACPACATRYVVPDSAIGAEGRTVRCAKCRHSWFQDGPELEVAQPAPTVEARHSAPERAPEQAPEQPAPPVTETAVRDTPVQEEVSAPPPPPPFGETAPSDSDYPPSQFDAEPAPPTVVEAEPTPVAEPEGYEEEVSAFDYEPPFRPRRNMMKVWTIAAALFALLALGTVAAVSYWGLPDWVPVTRPTFGIEKPDLVLDFPRDKQERRTLPNGTEYFGTSGTIKNVGRETRQVPSILMVLSDARDRIVYTWEISSPKPELAPGETVTINEAVTDIPKSARYVEIGWKPD